MRWVPPDADHAERIIRIMKGRKFRLSKNVEKKYVSFCRRLIADFHTQNGVTHIEPVARSETYGDKVFKPFRARCPGMELNGQFEAPSGSRPMTDEEIGKYSAEEWDMLVRDIGRKYFGTRNFKMYLVDLDGDAANGKEHVFYAERYYEIEDAMRGYFLFQNLPREIDWNDLFPPEFVKDDVRFIDGFFTVLDLESCRKVDDERLYDPHDYRKNKPRDAFSGVIRYRGRHYVYNVVFTLLDSKSNLHGYAIDVNGFGVDLHKYRQNQFQNLCLLTETPVKRGHSAETPPSK